VKRRSEESSITLSVGQTMIVLLEGTQYAFAVLHTELMTVCLSQASVLSKRLEGLSWFWHGLPWTCCTVFYRNSGTFNNEGTSLWNLVLDSALNQFICFFAMT